MARLPRLLLPGLPHLLSQRVQQGAALARDDIDRDALLALLRATVAGLGIGLHAYALGRDRLELLAAAADAACLSRLMQAVARRHAAAYNRRHGRRGSLWEGRFRAAVVEPGERMLECMVHVDAVAVDGDPRWSSRAAHRGELHDPLLSTPEAYWALGNTPFEREAAYAGLEKRGLTLRQREAIDAALRGGWPLGSAGFAKRIEAESGRRTAKRPSGRPSLLATHIN